MNKSNIKSEFTTTKIQNLDKVSFHQQNNKSKKQREINEDFIEDLESNHVKYDNESSDVF